MLLIECQLMYLSQLVRRSWIHVVVVVRSVGDRGWPVARHFFEANGIGRRPHWCRIGLRNMFLFFGCSARRGWCRTAWRSCVKVHIVGMTSTPGSENTRDMSLGEGDWEVHVQHV